MSNSRQLLRKHQNRKYSLVLNTRVVLANVALDGPLCNPPTIAHTFPNLIDDTFPTKKVFIPGLCKDHV